MPFSTAYRDQNQNLANSANSIAKIFVGDPAADAAYRDQQIKNDTEFQRQKLIAEQTVSEGTRRIQMEAAAEAARASAAQGYAGARANNGLAAGRERENQAYNDLGNMFTAGPVDMTDPTVASRVAGTIMQGGIDPKKAGAIALVPGQSNDTLGRIFTAGGQTIGANNFVSVDDRNDNRTFNTNNRVVQGDGTVIAQPVPPGMGGAGGKIPMLKQPDMNSMIRSAISARGAQLDPEMQVASYFTPQPELYGDLSQLINAAWTQSGGNAAAVQDVLGQYLGEANFAEFGQTNGRLNPFVANTVNTIKPAVDVQTLLQQMQPQAQAQPAPVGDMFTGGSAAPLPNLQNVGNGGWKVLGVQ